MDPFEGNKNLNFCPWFQTHFRIYAIRIDSGPLSYQWPRQFENRFLVDVFSAFDRGNSSMSFRDNHVSSTWHRCSRGRGRGESRKSEGP